MEKDYRYALLHFFEALPAPHYYGIIIEVEDYVTCPPIFKHMYAFQWVHSAYKLTLDNFNSIFIDIENDENFDVSTMYYIAKRLKVEHVSPKKYFFVCKANGTLRKMLVTTYMKENELDLLIPYVANDMEYELFIPTYTPNYVCITHNSVALNFSVLSLERFMKNNFSCKYYDQ